MKYHSYQLIIAVCILVTGAHSIQADSTTKTTGTSFGNQVIGYSCLAGVGYLGYLNREPLYKLGKGTYERGAELGNEAIKSPLAHAALGAVLLYAGWWYLLSEEDKQKSRDSWEAFWKRQAQKQKEIEDKTVYVRTLPY